MSKKNMSDKSQDNAVETTAETTEANMAKAESSNGNGISSPGLKSQRDFLSKKLAEVDFGIIVADAFVRGIRDIGYKSTGYALNELVDNSLQGEAGRVHVALGFPENSVKPDKLAVIDDGHGMEPTMIRVASLWGGTHREGNREGFGRYGYGLPSACVSQGCKFTIYSMVDGGKLYSLTFDVDNVKSYKDTSGRVIAPMPTEATLPEWVKEYMAAHGMDNWTHGTIVVIEKLDRIDFTTRAGLEKHLLENFGVVYQNFLRRVPIYVNGQKVEPLDPLFITPGYRYHEIPGHPITAEVLEPMEIKVKMKDENGSCIVRVRFSYMAPGFQREAEDILKEKGGKQNPRSGIRQDHNGIIVLRNGRMVDVVNSKCEWTSFTIYDRNIGIEVDFPPMLDEEFSVTTSKQQVVVSKRIWDILEQAGVLKALGQLRSRYKRDVSVLRTKREEEKRLKRASEQAMEEAEKFKRRSQVEPTVDERKAQESKLEEEAKKRARVSGRPVAEEKKRLQEEVKDKQFLVVPEPLKGAPFFRIEQRGGQKTLFLNTEHRFFTDVYAGPESTPRLRAGLEVLLFVIGDCQLSSTGDHKLFYQVEIDEWSKQLAITLDRLSLIHDVDEEDVLDSTAEEAAEATAKK